MLLIASALLLFNLLLLLTHPEEHSPPCPSQSQDQQKLCRLQEDVQDTF